MCQDYVGTIQRYCDTSYACENILVTLPAYNNANKIKTQAKSFGEELTKKKIVPGVGLSSYLEALKAGAALPKVFLPTSMGGAEPAADDEPEAKRQKPDESDVAKSD